MTMLKTCPPQGVPPVTDFPDMLSAAAAGVLLRERREDLGITQEQLAEAIGTDKSYISKLEGGVYNVGRSKYFPAVARTLRLSEADIRAINPSAVFDAPARSTRPLSAAAQGYRIPKAPRPIPEALREAAEIYGDLPAFAGLRERRWQEFMTNVSRHRTPSNPDEWMQEFAALKKMGYDPQDSDE